MWTVVYDLDAYRDLHKFSNEEREELDAIQHILREEGPDGLNIGVPTDSRLSHWDDLAESVRVHHIAGLGTIWAKLQLEIVPERTVIVRGLHPVRPGGRRN